MESLFENEFFRVTKLPGEPIIVVVRTNQPFPSPAAAALGCAPMLRCLDAVGRERHYLLLDSRDAVGNNDPAYEASFAQFRRDLVRGFKKKAVVVRTRVGELHTQRLLEGDQAQQDSAVFGDMGFALAFLRADVRRISLRPAEQKPSS